jgi:hypothetical protein
MLVGWSPRQGVKHALHACIFLYGDVRAVTR